MNENMRSSSSLDMSKLYNPTVKLSKIKPMSATNKILCGLIALFVLTGFPITTLATISPPTEKVRLQLKWFNQFQFAGYYAAVEQGYYADEGLEVEILERDINKSIVDQVVTGQSEYGIGDAGLLSQYAEGKPIVALAAIFQRNPQVYMTLQDSGITNPYEMVGKRIMADLLSADEGPLKAMLSAANVAVKDYTLLDQSNDYSLLTQGKVDAIAGYITDQPYYFKKQGIKVNIINPQDYGIDFYGDFIFTSQAELQKHPHRADKFLRASLKGWRYALQHSNELIKIIHEKYHSRLSLEHLRFESEETRKLILPDIVPIGQITLERLKALSDTYTSPNLNKILTDSELSAFVYTPHERNEKLTNEERAWLDRHHTIYVGVSRDYAPYEWIDDDGNYVGLVADYLTLIEKKLGVHFEIMGDKPWSETLAMAKAGKLDMLSSAVLTPERAKNLIFLKPYKSAPVVIIDNGKGQFSGGLASLKGKRVAVEKDYFMEELLRIKHPQLHLVLVNSTKEALKLVANGKVDAYVGDAATTNYLMKQEGMLNLRFSGQTYFTSRQAIAVHKSKPLLASILSKTLKSIPQRDADDIFNRWLELKIEQGVNHKTVLKYALFILGLLMLFLWWILRLHKEIKARKRAELLEKCRAQGLELITTGESLPVTLEAMVQSVEEQNPRMICSILLLDDTGKHLLHGAAPSLPDFYNDAIHGMEIAANAGSYGIAAFTNKRVIVDDVQNYPYWEPFKELAAQAGLRSCWSQPIGSAENKVLGTFAIYHKDVHSPNKNDITLIEQAAHLASIAIEKAQAEEQLRLAASVFTHAREGIMLTDADDNIIEVNDTFTSITGYSREEVIGQSPSILQSGRQSSEFYAGMWEALNKTGHWTGEIWNRRKSGEIYAEILTISAVHNAAGKVSNYVALFTDISRIKEHQNMLERMAHYDVLTNLPNRVLLSDRLSQAIAQCKRHSQLLAVVFLDLDAFKVVNDDHGHDIGDELLITVSERMSEALREGDTLARIGGDEFIAVLADLTKKEDCEPVLERLLQAAAEPVTIGGIVLQVTASLGVTLYPQDDADVDQLLRHADQAMYVAKQAGKNRYHLFDTEYDDAIKTQRENINNISTALERSEFVLYYQPKVNMRTGDIVGVEALIRWQHPDRGLILPLAFLPVIEGHDISLELGKWVIDTALKQISQWQSMGIMLDISVNISAYQLQQTDFVECLSELLNAHPDVSPKRLELEILETSALSDIVHVSSIMKSCQELGVHFSIDDFGTGYSSLTYLRRLPVSQIKIDQSFVRDMLEDPDDLAIVEGVVGLAKLFKRKVIAEGVETIEHGTALLTLGCELAQGYGIARPMPAADIPEWMESWKPDDAWSTSGNP